MPAPTVPTADELYRLSDTVRWALEDEDERPEGQARPTGELGNLRADFMEAVTCWEVFHEEGETSTYGRRKPPRPKHASFMRAIQKAGMVVTDYRASWPLPKP